MVSVESEISGISDGVKEILRRLVVLRHNAVGAGQKNIIDEAASEMTGFQCDTLTAMSAVFES